MTVFLSLFLLVTSSLFLRQVNSNDFGLCTDIAFKVHVSELYSNTLSTSDS